MEVALSPWLAFFTRGHTLYRTIQAQRVVFKDGKNGADLEDVCPLVLHWIYRASPVWSFSDQSEGSMYI